MLGNGYMLLIFATHYQIGSSDYIFAVLTPFVWEPKAVNGKVVQASHSSFALGCHHHGLYTSRDLEAYKGVQACLVLACFIR